MANHSLILLPFQCLPFVVEAALSAVFRCRFAGLPLRCDAYPATSAESRTYGAEQLWWIGTGATEREEVGFELWLHPDLRHIEVRHNINFSCQRWVDWVRGIVTHELAARFGVKCFDGGDGIIETDPARFGECFWEYTTKHFVHPLSPDDHAFFAARTYLWQTPAGFPP